MRAVSLLHSSYEQGDLELTLFRLLTVKVPGLLFGETPPPPGQKRRWEWWELQWSVILFAGRIPCILLRNNIQFLAADKTSNRHPGYCLFAAFKSCSVGHVRVSRSAAATAPTVLSDHSCIFPYSHLLADQACCYTHAGTHYFLGLWLSWHSLEFPQSPRQASGLGPRRRQSLS